MAQTAGPPGQGGAVASAPTGPNPRVRLAAGIIEGVVAPSGVRMFRGIPYAAPPVGALRWKTPQPVPPWQGVRSAAAFGPRCMQLPIYSDMVFRSNGMGEDCLYLNVWAPAARPGRKLPVLVYFYGGGFRAGDGSELRYDGESLATRGIVVVTLNYRLGVFGFLAHPELTRESPYGGSGDYGLLDQAAALQWVRRNIALFGGDPARITIAGESAGSISVSAQLASPLSRKLIAGAIGESGAMIAPVSSAPVPLAEAEVNGLRFAAVAAAASGSPAAADAGAQLSLARLRALPADTLLRLSGRPEVGRFPTTVDGYFFRATPARVFARGEQAPVPLLVGWNTEESGCASLLQDRAPTPENYAAVVRAQFGAQAEELLHALPGDDSAQVLASCRLLAGARFIAYSTWKWAELHGRTGGHPVFRYLYAHPRPAPVAPATSPPPTGAVHSAEIEYALGNLATNKVYAWTPDDERVSELLEGYFANFIRTGNPNGPGLPPWPRSGAGDSARTMVLEVQPHAGLEPHHDVYEILDRFYSPANRPVVENRPNARPAPGAAHRAAF